MKNVIIAGALLLLAGCTITRQAEVSHVDAPNGVVRLNYNQATLQNARYDAYLTNGTATRECQSMGYATASFYGEPIKTCSLVSGSVCLNETMTIQYKCLGYATRPGANPWY